VPISKPKPRNADLDFRAVFSAILSLRPPDRLSKLPDFSPDSQGATNLTCSDFCNSAPNLCTKKAVLDQGDFDSGGCEKGFRRAWAGFGGFGAKTQRAGFWRASWARMGVSGDRLEGRSDTTKDYRKLNPG
jgi:hypothetical protein